MLFSLIFQLHDTVFLSKILTEEEAYATAQQKNMFKVSNIKTVDTEDK